MRTLRKILRLAEKIVVLGLFATAATAQTTGQKGEQVIDRTTFVAPQKVLFFFPSEKRSINNVVELRDAIQRAGGRVRAVIGVAGVIADIHPAAAAELSADGVRAFSNAVDVPPSADAPARATLEAWNRLRLGAIPAREPVGPRQDVPTTDVTLAPDLPRTLSHLHAAEREYQKDLREFRRSLPAPLQRSSGVGCGTNGAGYFDTSLYFAGDIAVGTFYVMGTGGPWTVATTASEFANLVVALDHFIDLQPNARLTFTYSNEVDGGGLPLAIPSNERTYVNFIRDSWCADWAFMVKLINGGVWPNAQLFGPSLNMDTTFVPFADVLRHEVGHIFGAGDAYAPHNPSPRYGYMMAAHANGCGTGGGFFGGAGECLDDLMAGWGPNFGYNSIIGPSTAAQFGWLASDGRGALDLTKTKPAIDATSVVHVVNTTTSAVTVTYNGVAFDRPPLTELSFPYGDVSINDITRVQYRVNNAAWQDAAPADGVFDSVSEAFNFTTPPLLNGTYVVEIQAVNTVGAVESVPYAEQLVVTGSSVTNTRPFGFLTVTPERAKVGTLITASGAASRDLQPGALSYSWKWDSSAWTPFSSTPTATHVYTTPGTYAVQLRVRDQSGAVHLVSRNVTAESYDVPPVVAFAATPESRHFTTGAGYSIALTVAGTRDPETPYAQLRVQWDVDCDGWDGPPVLQKAKVVSLVNTHFQRSDRRCIRAQVLDAANNATQADRFIWVVPYDHRPSVAGMTFAPAGVNYTLTVNASDTDSATTWDGILEYRFDFDGDGVWDTTFDPTPTVALLAAYRYSVIVQVRDRFDARVAWLWCSPNFCSVITFDETFPMERD